MFDQNDDNQANTLADSPEVAITAPSSDADSAQAGQPATDSSSSAPADNSTGLPEPAIAPATDQTATDSLATNVFSPAGGYPERMSNRITPGGEPESKDDPTKELLLTTGATEDAGANNEDDLIEIKKKALDELLPLIDKLDLKPDEKFHTLMMIIQSSDNQDLIEKAYETAQSIEDEKERAQALLDIVNEINYFTHQPGISDTPKEDGKSSL